MTRVCDMSETRPVGYQTPDGMWSAHGLLANDGAIADSSGSEPPPLRMQPKLNVDLSL